MLCCAGLPMSKASKFLLPVFLLDSQNASYSWHVLYDLHFSSRLSFFSEYLIILAQRGKNRLGD